MFLTHDFQNLLDASSRFTALSLPTYKRNPLKIDFQNCEGSEVVYNGQEPVLPFAQGEVFHARVTDWRRLTAQDEDCKAVYEVSYDITGRNFDFEPGDTIGIIPHNHPKEVNAIINHLDLTTQADLTYSLTIDNSQKGDKIPSHVPVQSCLKHVLTHCLDIRGVVKKLFILALSRHTKEENERRVLEYLCSKEGSSAYTNYILNKNLSILDIFTTFKSCKPPIEDILANLPRLLPRPYSIANSRLKDPDILKICFSVIGIGNGRKGLTTSWLQEAITKDTSLENDFKSLSISKESRSDFKVPVYLRKNISGFRMPQNDTTSIILIGSGTGVAPYIGFMEEREIRKKQEPKINFGRVWLFNGCRNRKLDFIYEKELNDFVLSGALERLSTAFSRVNDGPKYVQDALTLHGEEVVKLMENGASVFVCGDHKTMATQVRETLEKCLVTYGQQSQQQAQTFLDNMQKENRYLVDIWSCG